MKDVSRVILPHFLLCKSEAIMKLEQGDQFEQAMAGWLREHLPTYEKVWGYILS
jgi:hypothetical protein